MLVRPSQRNVWLALIGAGVILAVYVGIYAGQPLPGPWNDNVKAMLVCLGALSSAGVATLIWRHFAATDSGPRSVARDFALALWLWAIAEIIVLIYDLLGGAPPLLSAADPFWLAAYVLFGGALLQQYHLVYRSTRAQEARVALALTGTALLASAVLTTLLEQAGFVEKTWLETFVSSLYPLLDLVLCLAALRLIIAFEGKLWSRPWMGLFAFAFADALYAVLEVTGLYDRFVAAANPLALIADTLYLAAYLVVAMACYSQLRLLRYGLPPAPASAAEPELPQQPPA